MSRWVSRYKWLLALGVGLLALFVLAACGDEEEEEGTPTGTIEGTPQAVAPCTGGPGVTGGGEALKIGVLVPSTGALSTFGPDYINAAELAAKCINNAGGVNGGAVEIVTGDTGTNPEQGLAEAERLVNVEGVAAIMGAASSAVSLTVAQSVTVPNQILQISPASTSPALTDLEDNDFVFRTPISDAAQGVVLAQLVSEDLGLTKVCDMYVNNAYGQGLSAQFAESYQELGGEVTASVPHEDASEAVSYASELNQCVAGDPEALVAISYPTGQAEVYLREAIEGNLITNFVFVDGTREDDLFEALGWDNFEGMYGTAPGALETEFGEAFDEAFEAEFGELYQSPFVREAFDSVIVMALSAAKAGTNTSSVDIRDSLRDVANEPGTTYGPSEDDIAAALTAAADGDDIDYQGASGSVEFDENGDISFGAIEIWKIENAQIVVDRRASVDLATGEVEPLD